MPEGGLARAGVVICAPHGREYVRAHYALRLLAEKLADDGLCALRIDYDGTGDSAGGEEDPDRVASWQASVSEALEFVRRCGVRSVGLIGMRLGATLAAFAAADTDDLGALVLWDPVLSGRAYVTEQRAMSALSFDAPSGLSDGSVETPGVVLGPATARDLRCLDVGTLTGALARRVLVLCRPERDSGVLPGALGQDHVRREVAVGQSELVDVPAPWHALPRETIERIGAWTSEVFTEAPKPVRAPPAAGPTIVSRHAGVDVVETPVFVGPARLFGIATSSPGTNHGPGAIFLSVANTHRIGPNRLWVELARRWAAGGVRSLRFDLSGVGDSPVRTSEQRPFVPWAPQAFDDVMDSARALSPDDPSNVVLVGHSASGYQVFDSGLQLHPRGVISLNPVVSFRPPEVAAGEGRDPRRRSVIDDADMVAAYQARADADPRPSRLREMAWRTRMLAMPRRRSSSWMRDLVRHGVDTLIVCGDRDARPLQLGTSVRGLRRLTRTGRFRFEYLDQLEHGLMISTQRTWIVSLTTEHFLRTFASGAAYQHTELNLQLPWRESA